MQGDAHHFPLLQVPRACNTLNWFDQFTEGIKEPAERGPGQVPQTAKIFVSLRDQRAMHHAEGCQEARSAGAAGSVAGVCTRSVSVCGRADQTPGIFHQIPERGWTQLHRSA